MSKRRAVQGLAYLAPVRELEENLNSHKRGNIVMPEGVPHQEGQMSDPQEAELNWGKPLA